MLFLLVFAGELLERRVMDTWFQFVIEVPIQHMFRHPSDFLYSPTRPLVVFIEKAMIDCKCGDMTEGKKYLLLIDTAESYYAQNTFHVKNFDAVLPLSDMRLKKVKNLHSKQQIGKCKAFEYPSP